MDAIAGHRWATRAAGRARVPVLPGLLSPPAGHDEPDPVRGTTSTGVFDNLVASTQIQIAREGHAERARRARALPREPGRLGGDHAASRSSSRRISGSRSTTRCTSSSCSATCCRPATSAGSASTRTQSWWEFCRRRAALARLPAVPRRRPDALAGRGARQGDERPHGRLDPAAAAAGPRDARRSTSTACSTGPTSDVWIAPWVERAHGGSASSCASAPRSRRSTAAAGRVTGDLRRRGLQRHGRLLRRGRAGRGAARAHRDGRPQAPQPARWPASTRSRSAG